MQVIGLLQLTTGSTVGFARSTLEALVNDITRDADERGYFADMLSALEGKPDDDLIGDSLDDVPCRLKEATRNTTDDSNLIHSLSDPLVD